MWKIILESDWLSVHFLFFLLHYKSVLCSFCSTRSLEYLSGWHTFPVASYWPSLFILLFPFSSFLFFPSLFSFYLFIFFYRRLTTHIFHFVLFYLFLIVLLYSCSGDIAYFLCFPVFFLVFFFSFCCFYLRQTTHVFNFLLLSLFLIVCRVKNDRLASVNNK